MKKIKQLILDLVGFFVDLWFAFIGVKQIPSETTAEIVPSRYKKLSELKERLPEPMMFYAYCTNRLCVGFAATGRRKVYPKVKVGTWCPHCSYPLSTSGQHKVKANKYDVGVNTK